MIEVATPFVFPGEGAVLGGVESIVVTADTPIDSGQLPYIPGTPQYRARLRDATN